MIDKVSLKDFRSKLMAQGMPSIDDVSVICPICGTIQSTNDLIKAGLDKDKAARQIGFSCIGRTTGAGPYAPNTPEQIGCDWTLGGLFNLHKMVVIDEEGVEHPRFIPATPEQAKKKLKAGGPCR